MMITSNTSKSTSGALLSQWIGSKMTIPEKIQNLSNAFGALGFRTDILHFKWPDNEQGFVIHVGEVLCECHDGSGNLLEYYSTEPMLSLSFSESELKDIESQDRKST